MKTTFFNLSDGGRNIMIKRNLVMARSEFRWMSEDKSGDCDFEWWPFSDQGYIEVYLDLSLKKVGSNLVVLKCEPSQVLTRCLKEWDVKKLCFEYETEPYYQALDRKVKDYASSAGIEVFCPVSHTLINPADIVEKNGRKPSSSYQSFLKLAGEPSWASSPLSVSFIPLVGDVGSCEVSVFPTLEELGYTGSYQDGNLMKVFGLS